MITRVLLYPQSIGLEEYNRADGEVCLLANSVVEHWLEIPTGAAGRFETLLLQKNISVDKLIQIG